MKLRASISTPAPPGKQCNGGGAWWKGRARRGARFIVGLLCPVIVAVAGCSRASGPDVVLIIIDTLRADHLGTYGYYCDTSPSIDAFAKESIVFENAVVQSPWTLPSHMSMLTSLYPSSHGVIKEDRSLADEHITLAELMREGGYRTAAFTDGWLLRPRYGFDQGFDTYKSERVGIKKILPQAKQWLKNNKMNKFFLFISKLNLYKISL